MVFTAEKFVSTPDNEAEFLADKQQDLEKEQTKESVDLLQKQQELFAKIENLADDLPRDEMLKIVSRLFEHSLSDGLNMAETLHLTPNEIIQMISNPRFYIKHKDFCLDLRGHLKNGEERAHSKDQLEGVLKNYDYFDQQLKDNKYSDLLELAEIDKPKETSAKTTIKEMDNVFAEFLKLREFKGLEATYRETEATNQEAADNHLRKLQRALEKNYYTGTVLKRVFDLAQSEDPHFVEQKAIVEYSRNKTLQEEYRDFQTYHRLLLKGNAPQREIAQAFMEERGVTDDLVQALEHRNLIGIDTLEKIRDSLGMDGDVWSKRFDSASYKLPNISTKQENSIIKGALIKELNHDLKRVKVEERELSYLTKFETKTLDYFERLIKEGVSKAFIAEGLAGLDSPQAWAMREQFINEGVDKGFIARGLAGLDSPQAWAMREQFINEGVDKGWIALGLAGLDSPQAWAMREQFINEGVDKDWIALGVNGDYTTFVWRLNRKKEESNLPLKLQKKLDLLNLVNKPTLEGINKRFDQEDQEDISVEEKIKRGLSNSQRFAGQVSDLLKQAPQNFLDTMSGKRDRLTAVLVKRTISKTFPEIIRKSERLTWRDFPGYFGLNSNHLNREANGVNQPQDFLNPRQNMESIGGDPRSAEDARREIMQLRDNIGELIVTGLYGKYNKDNNSWEKSFFAHQPTIMEPAKETTITLPEVSGLRQANLPKPINSRIIKERIKGIDNSGQEIVLESNTNSLGEVVAEIPKNIKKIVYSLEYNQAPKIMRQLTEHEYRNYHRQFKSEFGDEMNQEMCHLPEEIEVFINSIAELEPKEKVKAIESFVREYSYYDFDNKDVIPLKRGKGLEELLMIMETRMAELKQIHPELSDKLSKKRFAGVCHDFNMLVTAMLRQAGLTAGFAQGFMAHDKSVRLNSAHGTAFVVWPDELNKNAVFTVDGTPGGVTAEQNEYLSQIQQPSLEQQENRAEEMIEEIKKEAE
ncbi:MAG: hypothetical protein ABH884_01210, partial [Candidatus Komeilibacteria bacterium]